ncbi:hypothetical protein niasHT_005210 [Heterodera trifolii]|uniref:Uncharacterized protein n=1 Tax=Heterodera trifolii TaxID=157864 RepID=A0ABD2LRV5_9BILA
MAFERVDCIESFEIPRPKCVGMEFIPISGRYGYYQTVNKSVAIKYGLSQQRTEQQKQRPKLPNDWRQMEEKEEAEEKRTQRKMGDRCNGKTEQNGRQNKAQGGAVAEPMPDYDEQQQQQGKGAFRFAFPDGRSPPLSAILRQSLLANHSKFRQEPEKLRHFYDNGETNAFMKSTFRDEQHLKKMVMGNGEGGEKEGKREDEKRI